eukprot:TRINITY_DN5774_c0_g1_i1.p1 TRINITY_DN5774_c0_g1~~TRINITY_DN5774_c0_g1_i1.p1  ORF type:complete len:105 (-),score=22.32 TRINITY_DN5774_c0_g1_i1:78-392(-)
MVVEMPMNCLRKSWKLHHWWLQIIVGRLRADTPQNWIAKDPNYIIITSKQASFRRLFNLFGTASVPTGAYLAVEQQQQQQQQQHPQQATATVFTEEQPKQKESD